MLEPSATATWDPQFADSPGSLRWLARGTTISQFAVSILYGAVGVAALVLGLLGLLVGPWLTGGSTYLVRAAELGGFGLLLLGAIVASYVYCFRNIRAGRLREAQAPFLAMALGNLLGAVVGLALGSDLVFDLALLIASVYFLLFWVARHVVRHARWSLPPVANPASPPAGPV